MAKPIQFNDWPESIQPGFGPYRAVIERIVDSDTVYTLLDLGCNEYAYHSIRLKDVDGPEIYTSDPEEKARGFATRDYLANSICPPGTKVLLFTEKDRTTFGRYIGTLKLENGSTVNDLMNTWLASQA